MSDEKTPAPPTEEEIQFGDELAVLPIRNAVLFPGAVAPFDVGREKSVALVEDVHNLPSPVIAIFAQRDPSTDDPSVEDLYPVGCAARVLKALKHSSGNYSLILQGLTRIRLDGMLQQDPYLRAKVTRIEGPATEDVEAEALAMSLRDVAKQVIQLMPELPREAGSLIDSIQAPGALADLVAANLDAPVEEKAQLIETVEVKERIRKVLRLLTRQLEILKMRERINSQIKEEMGKNQREYVLRQQLKAIKEELGEDDGDQGDLDGLEDRIAKADLPSEADSVAKKQLKRLRTMQVGSAEYTVVRTYLDWILDLPWKNQTQDIMDIGKVREVLDEDHYGLRNQGSASSSTRRAQAEDRQEGPASCTAVSRQASVRRASVAASRGRWVVFAQSASAACTTRRRFRSPPHHYRRAPGSDHPGMKKSLTINPVFDGRGDKIGHDFLADPSSCCSRCSTPSRTTPSPITTWRSPDLSSVMFVATANVADPIPPLPRDRGWRSEIQAMA
ncbi:MAG: LON peptidase substrate-binding domain-containing protein [Polyangiaceae bacterium]